jgi:heptosyltransferase-3
MFGKFILRKINKIKTIINSILVFSRILLISLFVKRRFLILTEHLGDVVSCSGIPEELFKKDKIKIIWIINKKYKSILIDNPYLSNIISVNNLGEWILVEKLLIYFKCKRIVFNNMHFNERVCTETNLILDKFHLSNIINKDNYYNYGSLVEVFSIIGGLDKFSIEPKIYTKISNQLLFSDKYLILHTTSNESSRNWNFNGWNELTKYLLKNTEYKIVEIGYHKVIECESSRYINYTGFRKIEDILNAIYYSQKFIGIDSGFAHIANAYCKSSIILLGNYRLFKKYMPYSGYFQNNESKTIFRYSGNLGDMSFDSLISFLKINL